MFFEIDNSINLNAGTPRLKGNQIHKVTLKDIKAEDLEGKDGKKYQVIYLRFENAEGEVYEHRFFPPSATEALVDSSFGGKQPSDLTQFRFSLQHMIEVLNKPLYDKILGGQKYSIKKWADMRVWAVKALTPGKDLEVELKLLQDNKGYATLPKYPAGVSKNGDLYMKTRFIGHDLQFTAAEKKAMENQDKAAKNGPSSMADEDFTPTPPATKEDDNFDI